MATLSLEPVARRRVVAVTTPDLARVPSVAAVLDAPPGHRGRHASAPSTTSRSVVRQNGGSPRPAERCRSAWSPPGGRVRRPRRGHRRGGPAGRHPARPAWPHGPRRPGMKPLPPERSTASLRACDSGSSGRGNGTRSSTTRLHEGPGTSTPCQRPSVPNRQVRGSSANCATSVGTRSSPWQSTGRSVRARTDLGRRLGGPAGGEQPEGAPTRGLDQGDEPVVQRLAVPVAPGGGQVCGPRTGSPGGRSRRGSRRPGPVQPPRPETEPAGEGVEPARAGQRGGGRHDRAGVEQPGAQQAGHVERGRLEDGAAPVVLLDPDDVDTRRGLGDLGLLVVVVPVLPQGGAGTPPIRSATSACSTSAARAAWAPPPPRRPWASTAGRRGPRWPAAAARPGPRRAHRPRAAPPTGG